MSLVIYVSIVGKSLVIYVTEVVGYPFLAALKILKLSFKPQSSANIFAQKLMPDMGSRP
jgi:amino acid permease